MSPRSTSIGIGKNKLTKALATACGLGYLPAPGTFGSIPGLGIGCGIFYSAGLFAEENLLHRNLFILGLLILLTVGAYLIIKNMESMGCKHDAPEIVLDEIIGQAIAISFFPPSVLNLLIGFVTFRALDILKPGPVGWADKKIPGAAGILMDDVLAGLGALAVVSTFASVFPPS